MSEVSGLIAVYSDVCGSTDTNQYNWPDDGSIAWRVCIVADKAVFPMKFARERDALAAINAVADMGDWLNDWRSIVNQHPKEIKERFVNAMQW